jgi:hypothetical protein
MTSVRQKRTLVFVFGQIVDWLSLYHQLDVLDRTLRADKTRSIPTRLSVTCHTLKEREKMCASLLP